MGAPRPAGRGLQGVCRALAARRSCVLRRAPRPLKLPVACGRTARCRHARNPRPKCSGGLAIQRPWSASPCAQRTAATDADRSRSATAPCGEVARSAEPREKSHLFSLSESIRRPWGVNQSAARSCDRNPPSLRRSLRSVTPRQVGPARPRPRSKHPRAGPAKLARRRTGSRAALRVGCRLAMQCCRKVAAFLTGMSTSRRCRSGLGAPRRELRHWGFHGTAVPSLGNPAVFCVTCRLLRAPLRSGAPREGDRSGTAPGRGRG